MVATSYAKCESGIGAVGLRVGVCLIKEVVVEILKSTVVFLKNTAF
jgi:hypothetical protein